jgi:hypothetical protein
MHAHEEEEDPYAGFVDIADDEELPAGLEDDSDDELPYDLSDEGVALLQQQHDCVSDAYLQALTGQQVRTAHAHCPCPRHTRRNCQPEPRAHGMRGVCVGR